MNVLIATATAGGGHLAAAAALEEGWRKAYPRDLVKRVDILDYTPKLYRKTYAEGYVRLAEKAPDLYAHAFRRTDTAAFAQRAQKLRRWTARWVTRKFWNELDAFEPDILLAPHFLPLESVGAMPAHRRPFVVCVVTDFEAHALWMEPCVDLYCVAVETTRARLVARGIPAGKVKVTGIPVSLKFIRPPAARTARQALELDLRLRTLLVLGGGLGMGPLEETVRRIDESPESFQFMVVTGRNETLRRRLSQRRFRHSARILGFSTNMMELMSASDLIVTKPGGLTTSEALAVGRPLLVVNPLPGQEAANSDYLLENGAAVKVNRLEDLPYRLKSLSATVLKRMARAAKAIGRPDAATAVCRVVRSLASPFMKGGQRGIFLLLLSSNVFAVCALEKDEEVLFFPAAASLSDDGKTWEATIRGWVYEPEKEAISREAMTKALRRTLGLAPAAEANPLFRERIAPFIVDNERKKALTIDVAKQMVMLDESDAAGRVEHDIVFPAAPVVGSATVVSFQTTQCLDDPRRFSGVIYQIPPEGLSVISDIDDTIKDSNVLNRSRLLAGTFLEPYRPVTGMAETYTQWAKEGMAFHYLSASPWPLFQPLKAFLASSGFPDGTLVLRPFRAKSFDVINLFQSPDAYKTRELEFLLRRYPRRQFVLVGDSGERDPEIFGEVARRFLPQIRLIAIREVAPALETRYRKAFRDLPLDRWMVFNEPGEMSPRLVKADPLWAKDAADILRLRSGLISVIDFAKSRPDLFPASAKATAGKPALLLRHQKEEIWNAWKRFLDYLIALDGLGRARLVMPIKATPAEIGSFSTGYGAFLAKYRMTLEFLSVMKHNAGFEQLLNEEVPELGLGPGTYRRLRFRFLNVAPATQFSALATVYKGFGASPHIPEALRRSIEEDTEAIWRISGQGQMLTVKNAWQVFKNAGFSAWFPLQTAIASWMGDVKVYRPSRYLITQDQIATLRKQLQPGDVLLERREWYLSNVGLPGYWPHAAMYVGTSDERKAFFKDLKFPSSGSISSSPAVTGGGPIKKRPLMNGSPTVALGDDANVDFETYLQRVDPVSYAKSQVFYQDHTPAVLEAISEGVTFTSLEHSAEADSLAVLRPQLSKRDKALAIERAFHYAGRPYDFNFDFSTDSTLVCSELVTKAYEPAPGFKGVRFDVATVLGRPVTPPNMIVKQYDRELSAGASQLKLVTFLDGREWHEKAVPASAEAFRHSWRRPKWHIWIQEKN